MTKKIIAIVLCIAFLTGLLPGFETDVNAAEKEPEISILYEGKAVEEIQIRQEEKKVLSAKTSTEAATVQWQILTNINTDEWADISGMDQKKIEISYAMVRSMLDMSGSTYLRCRTGEGEKAVYSAPVCVTVEDHPKPVEEMQVWMEEPKSNTPKEPETPPEYVYVIINYLGEDGKELFSSYKGQIEYNTDFNQKIIIPTFLGFGAFVNEQDMGTTDPATADARKYYLQLDYADLKQDVVINIYYKPVEVPYGSRYFFQNIHDDMYKEETERYFQGEAKTGTIIDDATLNANAGDITGFTPLYHYPEAVAADGSTVFQVYYDRNYYLVNFDMDGGYGTEPVYARYQTPFAVNEPSRSGYTFQGWDLLVTDTDGDQIPDQGDGTADVLPHTIPPNNLSYKALWTRGRTEVTYVYWKENANNDEYSYWCSKKAEANSGDEVTFGDDVASDAKDRPYFKYNAARTEAENAGKVIEGDGSTVVNVYYTRNTYTLRFYFARKYTDWKGSVRLQVAGNTNGFPATKGTDLGSKLESGSNVWIDVNKIPSVEGWPVYDTNIGGTTYYYLEFTGKYNCDLSTHWPLRSIESVQRTDLFHEGESMYFGAWTPENSTYYIQNNGEFGNNVTVKGLFLRLDHRILHKNDANKNIVNFLGFWTGYWPSVKWTYHIDIPKFDGSGYDQMAEFVTYDTNTDFSQQTPTSIEGFTYDRNNSYPDQAPAGEYHAHYRYKRNEYELKFYNHNNYLPETRSVPYHAPMSDMYVEPTYPSGLEKNAYQFDGWYTSAECVPGTEYDFSGSTMPAQNLTLYAHWIPVSHTVNFFRTKEDMLAYEQDPANGKVLHSHQVEHGKILGSVDNPSAPQDQKVEYTFGGWFYMKNGVRIAYTPLDIPVIQNMNVFAEWGSKVAQPYVIHYVLKKDPSVQVAPDTIGYAYQGSTRTFGCKVGNPYNQLYPEYNKGYFPTLASHSITMQYEEDKKDPVHNTFTFEYVEAKDVEYKVRYLDAATNEVLSPEKIEKTSNGIVTERFRTIAGFIPDSFYKRLSIAVVKDENGNYVGSPKNVITFYYTRSETTAFYAVHHMIQKPDTDGTHMDINGKGDYEESSTYIEGIADIDSRIGLEPMVFTGFEPKQTGIQVIGGAATSAKEVSLINNEYTIEIGAAGTELYIFYGRKNYPYKVKYKEFGKAETEPDLAPEKIVGGSDARPYDSTVEESPIHIPGFAPISPDSRKLKIRVEDDPNNIHQNVITFYYTKLQYTADYKVSGKGGTVTQGSETIEGDMKFAGSKPVPDQGYRFVGWFTDEKCKVPVTEKTATIDPVTFRLEPKKENARPSPAVNQFYAKFEPITGSLTITRSGSGDEGEGDQVFVYRITEEGAGNGGYFDVTIQGNGSVTIRDLQIGKYKVQQIGQWSWRYEDPAQSVEIKENMESGIEFHKPSGLMQWINGYSKIITNRKNKGGV